jgi:hypothetical protein
MWCSVVTKLGYYASIRTDSVECHLFGRNFDFSWQDVSYSGWFKTTSMYWLFSLSEYCSTHLLSHKPVNTIRLYPEPVQWCCFFVQSISPTTVLTLVLKWLAMCSTAEEWLVQSPVERRFFSFKIYTPVLGITTPDVQVVLGPFPWR